MPCQQGPYGTRIEKDALDRIEKAELFLKEKGLTEVRVRDYGKTARIEILQEEFRSLLDGGLRRDIVDCFKALGYIYITIDLEGFRSGSMNEVLK